MRDLSVISATARVKFTVQYIFCVICKVICLRSKISDYHKNILKFKPEQ